MQESISAGLFETVGDEIRPTAAAAARLRRHRDPERPFLAQNVSIVRQRKSKGKRSQPTPLVNMSESPIALLARRGKASRKAYLAPAQVDAAERLRREFERGQLQPRTTADWTIQTGKSERRGGRGDAIELSDIALDARSRFNEAVVAVGPELSGVLIDVCCFLKGLQTVERERDWPARSAKIVLVLALTALARHYGFQNETSGRPRSRRLGHWGAHDYRPKIDG